MQCHALPESCTPDIAARRFSNTALAKAMDAMQCQSLLANAVLALGFTSSEKCKYMSVVPQGMKHDGVILTNFSRCLKYHIPKRCIHG